ncbi:hypothetical protein EMGBS10_05740 [Opitutia bacterium]|nr:hypothetical protein EMGBS10_05740 [Opitutae bacterium]
MARGDKPNPEDDDLPDDDEDGDAVDVDEDRPRRPFGGSLPGPSADPKPTDSKPAAPKSTPPPAEGDLSSLD